MTIVRWLDLEDIKTFFPVEIKSFAGIYRTAPPSFHICTEKNPHWHSALRALYGKKPETFDFLGFTFYCGKGRKSVKFCVKLKTSRKKYAQKLKTIKEWLYANKDLPVKELITKLNRKLTGHYRYYGVSYNGKKLGSYLHYTEISV